MKERIRSLAKRLHVWGWVGVAVAIYISYYLVVTVKHNYELQSEIKNLQTQIGDLQIEKDQLKYKIQYYQTDAYKEKQARAKLGLQAPGEGVVILPHSDDSHTDQSDAKPRSKKSNVEKWADFLLGRQ